MQPVNTIIFDLGGVLIDWNPEYVYREVIPDVERRRFFFENICTHEWNLEQDAGRPLAEATELLVNQHPEWESEIRDYYGRWEDMLGGPLHDTVDLLRDLRDRNGHRLLALTNWSGETFPVALAKYDFLHWFEGIVVSGDEKVVKPSPDIYNILLNRYAVQPAQAVFIDDNLKNVEGAEALGIRGLHFKGAEDLRNTLSELGVV